MWAQLMKVRAKPEADLVSLFEQLQAIEQPDSGLLRTTAMRSQSEPDLLYTLVLFESEEKARARENDPRRQKGLESVRTTMADLLDGSPEFVDLTVIHDA